MKKSLRSILAISLALAAVCTLAAAPLSLRGQGKVPDPSDVITAGITKMKPGDLRPVVLKPTALLEDKGRKADMKRYIREGDGIITAGIAKVNIGGGSGDITAFKNGGGSGSITSGGGSSCVTTVQKAGRIFVGCGYLAAANGRVTDLGKDLSS